MRLKLLVLIFLFLLFFVSAEITGESVTGEIVTGEATSKQISMSINVILPEFSLELISPENETYIWNVSLPLEYLAVGESFVWYNFDNGNNFSVSNSFNVTEGFHTIYLFANNSLGSLLIENISFTINLSKLLIDYDFWFTGESSSCNDFNKTSFEDLQSLNYIFFENNYGKINFSEAVNVSNDINFSDSFVGLDENIIISSNRIFVNSTALPNFDKSAVLDLYGLSFSNPRILKDGEVCLDCVIISYSGGNLKFSASGIGVYSAEETPEDSGETPSTSTTGSGGGGGEIIYLSKNKIILDKEFIKVFLKQGETVSDKLIIKNNHDLNLNFSVEVQGVRSLIKLNETFFEIGAGEEYVLNIDFLAPEHVEPNLYFGKLILKTGSIKKEINMIIEIVSKSALFDIEIIFPTQFEEIYAGDEIVFITKLTNLGEFKKADVVLTYMIKDFEGNTFVLETDSFAVETQASHPKTLRVPDNLPSGDYLVYVRLDYGGFTASASHQFKVKPLFSLDFGTLEIVLIIAIIAVMILLIFFYFRSKRRLKREFEEIPDKVIDEI